MRNNQTRQNHDARRRLEQGVGFLSDEASQQVFGRTNHRGRIISNQEAEEQIQQMVGYLEDNYKEEDDFNGADLFESDSSGPPIAKRAS